MRSYAEIDLEKEDFVSDTPDSNEPQDPADSGTSSETPVDKVDQNADRSEPDLVASATAPSDPSEREVHPFEFRGTAGEFFGIWIVNLLLTILTLGIYSAWAKVRTKRYFYGSTYVDNSAFEYHATPIQILIGRLIAVGAYFVFLILSMIPFVALILALALFFVMPWLIVRSLRFNTRMSSYRNVRLGFKGSYGGAFVAFLLWPLAGILTIGLLMPMAARAQQSFLVNNATFGGRPLSADLSIGQFYKVYTIGLVIMIALVLQFAFVGMPSMIAMENGDPAGVGAFFMSYLALIFGMLFVGVYIQTLVTNLVFGVMKLDDSHGFTSTMNPFTMLWIAVSNAFMIGITFGLMYPWARVRQVKYRASQTTFLAASDLSEFISTAEDEDTAIGEELAEVFDIEIGI